MKLSSWPLYISAPMLGLGQTLLLIFTPIYIEKSGIPLENLALIISLGSGLFFFSAPFWAKVSQTKGLKTSLSWGLFGFSMSFVLLYFSVIGTSVFFSLTLLISARFTYGLFASAIIPTTQVWLIKQAASDIQKPLATLSAILAGNRLIAPYLGALLLSLHWQAPIVFLCIIPLLPLLCVYMQMKNPAIEAKHTLTSRALHTKQQWIYLALIAQCATFGGLSFLLTPICTQWFSLSAAQASQMLASLMTTAAATMLVCHLLLAKFKVSQHLKLVFLSLVLGLLACILIWQNSLALLYLGLMLLSAGFAINQVSITTSLCEETESQYHPIITSNISKFQTLGYSIGALLLWITHSAIDETLIGFISLLSISLFITFGAHLYSNTPLPNKS